MGKPKPPVDISILEQERDDLWKSINESSPLGCVLLATSHIEKSLASILHRFFIADSSIPGKLLSFEEGPLGSLGSRNDMAFALGLIDEPIYKNLLCIGTIRNKFAHSHTAIDFTSMEIATLCGQLTIPPIIVDGEVRQMRAVKAPFSTMDESRILFVAVVVEAIFKLAKIADAVEPRKKANNLWAHVYTTPPT